MQDIVLVLVCCGVNMSFRVSKIRNCASIGYSSLLFYCMVCA